jgi:anti-sigma B factor antagonist
VEINTTKSGVWTVISASGEVDLHHSTDLRIEIIRQLDGGESVLLDMAAVSYIDSSGIAAMAQALSHARGKGLDFALVQPNQAVMRVLQLTRLDKVFEMHASVAEAPGA